MNHAMETRLLAAAREAVSSAYAPYSRYRVGAAVLDEQGRMFSGCNVENASYGVTLCAERVALCTAVAAGARRISALAVVADGAPPFPCGACLQGMAEFMDGDGRVFVAGQTGKPKRFRLNDLLPHRFALEK